MLPVTETSFALARHCQIIIKKDGKPEIPGFPILLLLELISAVYAQCFYFSIF